MTSMAAKLAGYAFYGPKGEGFAYALINDTTTASLTAPRVVAAGGESNNGSGGSRAAHFFPFLFLVVGAVLNMVLLFLIAVAFLFHRREAALSEKYWQFQYTHATVRHALVGELLDRTPVYPAPPSKRLEPPKMPRSNSGKSSPVSFRKLSPPQQQLQQRLQTSLPLPTTPTPAPFSTTMQDFVSFPSSSSPPLPVQNTWLLGCDPVGVYPPRESPAQQPLFFAPLSPTTGKDTDSTTATFEYNTMYIPVPILATGTHPATAQEKEGEKEMERGEDMQSVDTVSSTESEVAVLRPLRRRTSRVSFIETT